MTVCVIGDTAVIIKADHSGGEVMEGLEERKKSIGRPASAAGQIGEVLGNVVVPSCALMGKERSELLLGGGWSPSNADDSVERVKKGMDAGDVRGPFVGHAKEHDEGGRGSLQWTWCNC